MKAVVLLLCISLEFFSLEVKANSNATNTTKERYDANCLNFVSSVFTSRRGFPDGSNKCLGEAYKLGHQFEQYGEECSVEPQNESLTYGDCIWTWYRCIAQKSLGIRPLTLRSYADMMSGNLSDTVKLEIMSNLRANQSETLEANDSSINSNRIVDDELIQIKKYWKNYFNAEYEVCLNTTNTTCDVKTDTFMRNYWATERFCRNETIPDYRYHYHRNLYTYTKKGEAAVTNCIKTYNESHPTTGKSELLAFKISSALWQLCRMVRGGIIEQDEIHKPLNVTLIYYKSIVPKFFSESVKQHFFNELRTQLSQEYLKFPWNKNFTNATTTTTTTTSATSNSETVAEIVSVAVQRLKVKLRQETVDEDTLNVVTNSNILRSMFDVPFAVESKLCPSSQHN